MINLTTLPAGYRERSTLSLSSMRLIIVIHVLATVLLLPVGYLVTQTFFALNSAARGMFLSFGTFGDVSGDGGFSFTFSALWIVYFVVSQVLVIVLHEGVHGLFIWFYTHRRPLFGFTGLFPYAALPPGVYVRRNAFIVIVLAPLTLLGLALVPVTPATLLPVLWLFVFANTVGAAGDLAATAWVLRYPPTALAHDVGDAMTVYTQQA